MIKIALIAFIMSISFVLQAQNDLPRFDNDTLYTTSGFKITEKQMLKLGMGSTPDGSFKFIRINSASLFGYTSSNPNGANNANAGPRTLSGHEYKVLRIEKRGNKKNGYVYYCLLPGFPRYEIDVENAIAVGEIAVPVEFKSGSKNQSLPAQSLGDELKKLKDLFDAGALTKDEYDAAKKKLLN